MTRVVGIDVSKYQGTFDPDLATKPIDFVTQRASYGLVKDERFKIIYQGVQKIECRSAYHYYSTGSPWQDQADFFLNLTYGKGFKGLKVDFEHGYNNLNAYHARCLKEMLDYLKGQVPYKKILGYSGTYVYRDDLKPYADFFEYDWWFARFPWIPKPQTGAPKMPTGLSRPWTEWQYTKTGKGSDYGCNSSHDSQYSQYVDLNVFNGIVEEVGEYYNLSVGPPTPPPPVPIDCNPAQIAVLNDVITAVNDIKGNLGNG